MCELLGEAAPGEAGVLEREVVPKRLADEEGLAHAASAVDRYELGVFRSKRSLEQGFLPGAGYEHGSSPGDTKSAKMSEI